MDCDGQTAVSKKEPYKSVRLRDPYAALGKAVSYLMGKPSFAGLKFGHWAKTLTGQINRNHYFFVIEGGNIVGFLGWAFVNEQHAIKWANGHAEISGDLSKSGDCIIINAWAADNGDVNRFILRNIRHIMKECKAAYAKRFYKDGRVRSLRVTINDFVQSHIKADVRSTANRETI